MSQVDMPSLRLLVVEGNPLIADDLGKTLSAMGHVVTVAAHGKAALSCCMASNFDAMILDRMLSDISGIGLIAELARLGRRIPALMLGTRGSVRDRVDALYGGADDYLAKPCDMEELVARLHVILRRGKGAAWYRMGQQRPPLRW
jgi:two-component system OmpR family response regulator